MKRANEKSHTEQTCLTSRLPVTHESRLGDQKGPLRNRQAILHTADPKSSKTSRGLLAVGDVIPRGATSETKFFTEGRPRRLPIYSETLMCGMAWTPGAIRQTLALHDSDVERL